MVLDPEQFLDVNPRSLEYQGVKKCYSIRGQQKPCILEAVAENAPMVRDLEVRVEEEHDQRMNEVGCVGQPGKRSEAGERENPVYNPSESRSATYTNKNNGLCKITNPNLDRFPQSLATLFLVTPKL